MSLLRDMRDEMRVAWNACRQVEQMLPASSTDPKVVATVVAATKAKDAVYELRVALAAIDDAEEA